MNSFNNTTSNVHKNRATNAWGSGKNYDVKIGRISRDERFSKPIKQFVNTGYNTQLYMASSPSYLLNMAAKSDKAIHDDLRVNHDIQIPHAYLEKPYVGFSDRNYKFMKNRKPPGIGPNPIEAAGEVVPISEETGHWVQQFDQNYWQIEGEVVEGWTRYLSDTYWETGSQATWDGTKWDTNGNGYIITKTDAYWDNVYRPIKVEITLDTGGSPVTFYIEDSSNNKICEETNVGDGPNIFNLDYTDYGDIYKLGVSGGDATDITDIQFYTINRRWVDNQWTWRNVNGSIKVHDQSNWAKDFRPKKIRLTVIGEGYSQIVYLRDKNSNNIMTKTITPLIGIVTKYTFKLNWHKAGNIDTFGLSSSNTIGIRKQLNLIGGAGVTLNASDDAGNDEVDVTISGPEESDSVSSSTVYTQSPTIGVSLKYARQDHLHGTPNYPTWEEVTDKPSTFNPGTHATSHTIGGADALTVGIPVTIGVVNAIGGATDFVRRDHMHQGVHSVSEDGAQLD